MDNVKILRVEEKKKGPKLKPLKGNKVKLSDLIGITLRVDDYEVIDSAYNPGKKCIRIQVTYTANGEIVTSYVTTESCSIVKCISSGFTKSKICLIKIYKSKSGAYVTATPSKFETNELANKALQDQGDIFHK